MTKAEVEQALLLRFNRVFSKWACGSEFHNEPERIAERIEQAMEFHAGIAVAKAVKEKDAEIERLKGFIRQIFGPKYDKEIAALSAASDSQPGESQ